MDIGSLNTRDIHDKGAEVQIKDQHGKKTDVYIRVVGLDSKRWRGIMKQSVAGDKMSDNEILAKAVLDWRGLTDGGEELPFSYEAALNLLEIAPYIAEQIDLFIGRRVNFTKP